ncbi:hypothetical protein ABFT23_03425 [Nocardioides sp. C4-1]|uniref:hypothetical protein n=1 Tax=Nocardioides sp. C4-1 TaxID=3151851 RepID=UPI0032633A66
MTDALERRHRMMREELDRLWAALVLGLGCVLALVSMFVPMFSYVEGDDGKWDPADGQSTLLGLVGEPGESDRAGAIALVALVAFLMVVACLALTPIVTGGREPWAGWAMVAAAVVTLACAFTLLVLTDAGSGRSRATDDDVDLAAGFLLLVIVPVWFLVGRSRAASR